MFSRHLIHVASSGLTSDQVQRLLQATVCSCFPERDQALLMLLLGTGMHLRECASLTWGDLRFGAKEGHVWIEGNQDRMSRWVPINRDVCQSLLSYAASLFHAEPVLQALQEACPPGILYDLLWRNRRGHPLNVSSLTLIVATLAQTAGNFSAPHAMPRRLRDTFVARYLATFPQDLDGLASRLGLPEKLRSKRTRHNEQQGPAEELWHEGVF